MWFKRILLGYYAASLAVTFVTASTTRDAIVPKRRHMVERVVFPLLERRQQALQNETSSSEIIQPTSSDTTTFSTLASSEAIPTSTIINTPSIVITLAPSSTPTPTPSTAHSSSFSGQPSNEDGDSSANLESFKTDSLGSSASSIAEQQSSMTSINSLFTSPQDKASEMATSSTIISTTFISTGEPQFSSTLGIFPSAPRLTSGETTTTTFESTLSPETLHTPPPMSTSIPIIETSQIHSMDTSSMAVAGSTNPTSQLFPALTTPVEELSTTLSFSAPQLTSATGTSVETSSTTLQVVTASTAVPPSLMSSAIEPKPTSVLSAMTSMTETPWSLSFSSNLETTIALPPSMTQSSLFLSSEQSPTASMVESTPTISSILSMFTSSPVSSVPTAIVPSSLPGIFSSELGPSSSLAEFISMASDATSTSRLSTSPTGSAIITGITAGEESSSLAATSSGTVSASTLTQPLSIDAGTPTSPAPVIFSTDESIIVSTISSQLDNPSMTAVMPIESTTLMEPSSETIITGSSSPTGLPILSFEPSNLPSVTSGNGFTSSFAPSETNLASATSLVGSSLGTFSEASQILSSSTFAFSGTQPSFSEISPSATSNVHQSESITLHASDSRTVQSQTPTTSESVSKSTPLVSKPSGNSPSASSSLVTETRLSPSQNSTVGVTTSSKTTRSDSTPPAEASSSTNSLSLSSDLNSLATPTLSSILSFASFSTKTIISLSHSPASSSVFSNGTQMGPVASMASATITATFSTVYVSSIRSGALDLSTVAFSLLNSVTDTAVNQTGGTVSSTQSKMSASVTTGMMVPASESLRSSGNSVAGANATWSSTAQPSISASTGLPGRFNSSTSSKTELGITFSHSLRPSGVIVSSASGLNATQAETLQTSSRLNPVNFSSVNSGASTTSRSDSSIQTDISSTSSASGLEAESATDSVDTDQTNTLAAPHTPTSTPSQTAAAGSPPPLTTSQTAGVAVGGTTFILIAVVAAIFIARRYHAAKSGKRMSSGSVYPKVAYLYDPKTGGDGGDAEALMSGAIAGPASKADQSPPKHVQRHSTGTASINRFTSPGDSFRRSIRDPAIHRYSESEHVRRMDTVRALSAAVAGYASAPRNSSTYAKYPSNGSNPFSDHVIPSPTFAPFSPDDIRRPELKRPQSMGDERGEYSQVPENPYAYLNTAASMYPPISPYGRPPTEGPSATHDTRRQTMDSDPFADPFEHDLLLQVDERNRTSDSVTIFAPSPNLKSPRTPRTPVGPKLPVKQPNGMTSARSLLSPVAAKYMHKAQEVKIPRKSIASPILVQVGRSPVIRPFSPPQATPEHLGWEDIKRHSEKRFSDERSVPAPLKFTPPSIKKKPAPSLHTRTKPSLTGEGQPLLAGTGLPLAVKIPQMYNKRVGLDVPQVHGNPDLEQEDMSSDPVVREKRSRELRFADPALVGKEF